MKLTVGITQLLPEWKILVNQIGVSYEDFHPIKPIKPDQASVIIVTRQGLQTEKNILLQYLNSGGSILIEANIAEWLFDIQTVQTFINNIEPIKDSIFGNVIPGYIQTKLYLPKNGNMLEVKSGKKLVQIYTLGKGTAIIIPGGFANIILDTKARRRNFPTRALHLPSERVACRSKHTIREVIQTSLEYLHYIRDLPFLYLSPFPEGKQSIFNFRVDTDFASEKEIDSLYQTCLTHNISATWFVETKSAINRMEQFASMQNQEIGLHCYNHKVTNQYNSNKLDINKGINILNKANIPYYGYAAPYGDWNIPLAKAIEQTDFIYSSEFTLDYDNYPFYPYLNNYFTSVLQIPVHPICIGRLINARHGENEIINYYKNVIQEKIHHNLPIFIYDHPSLENINIINWLFQFINKKNLNNYSLQHYAKWWKKRLEINWIPKLNNDKIYIQFNHTDSSIYLNIKKSFDEIVSTEMKDVINLFELQWKHKKYSNKLITPMEKRIKLNRKMVFNNILSAYWRLKQ